MKTKEQKKAEEQRKEDNQKAYNEYVGRIEKRIQNGEKIEVKPFENWIRKVKRTDRNGQEEEVEVAGDSGETGHEKFLRLGKSRMEKALNVLDTVMNLSSPQYESTPAEQEKMVNALKLKVQDIENSFKSQTKQTEVFDF